MSKGNCVTSKDFTPSHPLLATTGHISSLAMGIIHVEHSSSDLFQICQIPCIFMAVVASLLENRDSVWKLGLIGIPSWKMTTII
jgi:hypothetical protein